MSYHLYQTDGFVIDSFSAGEANQTLVLFTRELGMVYASAKSIRAGQSKLRPSLARYSFSALSLVRGRELWRVTGAHAYRNYYYAFADAARRALLVRSCTLLKRLCAGEEQNYALFDTLTEGFGFLEKENLSAEEIKNFECVLVLRILYALGYLGESGVIDALAKEHTFSKDALAKVSPVRRRAISAINKSLKESQL